MESQTKTKTTAEERSLLVHSAFGSQITIVESCELTGGYFNAAYRLLLSDGTKTILKVAPSQEVDTLTYEHNIMESEVAALRLMKSSGGVPAPDVYAYDNSHDVFPCDYFFMEYIEGQPYNEVKEALTVEERAAIEFEMGAYNRIINGVAGTFFGMFSNPMEKTGGTWREAFMELIHNLLEDARRLNARLPISYELIQAELAKKMYVLDEVTEPRLVHWDLWDGNVFVRDGRIVALIDWERALWGDPLMEYYFRYHENSAAFYQGYGVSYNSPNENARKKIYDLYIDLIFLIECYSRKYESEGHLKWAYDNLVQGWARFTTEEGISGHNS